MRLVNWADEEGARFGRSLFGSSRRGGLDGRPGRAAAAHGRATASRCPTRSRAHGVDLDRALEARSQLENAAAYLELHIEQGPVLESLDLPLGVVLGTFGVERHRVTWRGQAAHAGSTPMDKRRDALAGAAKLALEIREIAARDRRRRRLHDRAASSRKPGIVTSVVETAEQPARPAPPRRGEARRDARATREARVERFAQEEDIEVEWERIWSIEPILFDEALIELADESIREVAGTSHRLPSGPLHDAAEVARAGVPTVMLFVQSLRGLSHTKLEDTKHEHLELVGAGARPARGRRRSPASPPASKPWLFRHEASATRDGFVATLTGMRFVAIQSRRSLAVTGARDAGGLEQVALPATEDVSLPFSACTCGLRLAVNERYRA